MSRGPKTRTAANSTRGFIRHASFAPPSELTDAAKAEYNRLIEVLMEKGVLDRLDLGLVAECARIKDVLDQAYKAVTGAPDRDTIKMIGLLTSQRRGMLRELSLTLQPSRANYKANAIAPEREADPIASHIKLSG